MTRARIAALFVALAALSAALSACGGGSSSDPKSVVEEATLKGIESGDLDLAVKVGIEGKKPGAVDVGLSGPFQSEEEADLPELDLAFAVKGSVNGKKLDREGGLTLLGGNKAYVGYEGTEYEVDPTTLSFVKSLLKQQSGKGGSNEGGGCTEALGELEVSDFVDHLKGEGSAEVGGTSTTKVSGDLNASSALEAFSKLVDDPACAAQISAAGLVPTAAELDKAKSTVKQAVKSAHVTLYVGDDHIVRRVVAKATIEPPKGSGGGAKKVDADLDMTLTGVNEGQTISAPSRTKPLSDLFVKLGVNPIELLGALQGGGGAKNLGKLLEKFSGIAGDGSSQGEGQQSYYECLGKSHTAADLQNCTGLLQ